MKQLKSILQIAAANLALLAIAASLLELAFGGWLNTGRLNRLNLIKDTIYSYDVSAIYRDPDPIIIYSRDRFGLRGDFSSPRKIDLLTVGGSTTDQRYIRDGETWQDVLEQQFQRAGTPVVIANAGVDGQSTFGHIKNFKWWFSNIPGLAPEHILYYVGINDFYKSEGYAYDKLLREKKKKFKLSRALKENSAIWYAFRTLRGTYIALVEKKMGHRSVDFGKVEWTEDRLQDGYDFMQPNLLAYETRLRELADLTHDFGSQPIFVSQPSRKYRVTEHGVLGRSKVTSYGEHQINGGDFYYMMKRLDQVTQSVAREKGALYIDLSSQGDWADGDFYDFSHMKPQGAKKVGKLLYQALSSSIGGTN
jgi:hypothetical protein